MTYKTFLNEKYKTLEANSHDQIVKNLNNLSIYAGIYYFVLALIFGIAGYWLFVFSMKTSLIWITYIIVFYLAFMCLALLRSSIFLPKANHIPSGYRLDAHSNQKLFSDINDLQISINTAKIDYVVIDNSTNASMAKNCKLGLFKKVNVITIGWPLILLLTRDEVRSIFAHELGHMHINQKDIRPYTHKIFSISQNIKSLQGQIPWLLNIMYWPCVKYLFPKIESYYFQIRKLNEIRADEQEAKVFGGEISGGSLLKLYLVTSYMNNEFYHDLESMVYKREVIDSKIYQQFAKLFLIRHYDPALVKQLKNYLLFEKPEETTHPKLSKRLSAMRYDLNLPITFNNFANEIYFPEKSNDIHAYCHTEWLKKNKNFIENKTQAAKRSRERVEKFEKIGLSNLSANRILKVCGYYSRCQENDMTREYYKKGIQAYPNNFALTYFYGAYLFYQNDRECLKLLTGSTKSFRYGPSSFTLLSHYYYQIGDEKTGDEFQEKTADSHSYQNNVNIERKLSKASKFNMPTLCADDKDDLIVELQRLEIKSCSITELEVESHVDEPLYVLYVTPNALKKDSAQQIIKLEKNLNFVEMFKIIFAGNEKQTTINSILCSAIKLF